MAHVKGQLTVTQGAAMNLTPQQLVQQWIVGPSITVMNATFNGSTGPITSNQIGTFTTAGTAQEQLALNAGVLLTSGTAAMAVGPNNGSSSGSNAGGGGDPDLTQIAGMNTFDKCIIEFDFIPLYDTLRFRYVFASEEFYNYCNSINDAFGFFLSGPGITGPFTNNAVNIALMPYSTNPVTINNVCNDNSTNWCNEPNNPTGNGYQNCSEASGVYYEYDALTYVFIATHVLIPCSTYHIKLAVGDASDHILDSGCFLEKNSFNSVGLTIQNSFTVPAVGNYAAEGCSEAIISFVLPNPAPTPYTINYTIGGTATNGVDYVTIPTSVTVPSGEDSVAIVIDPFYDGIPEGTETVVLGINQPTCTGSNVLYDTIRILDNSTMIANAGTDDTICLGQTVTLTASATGGTPPYSYLWNVPGGHFQSVQYTPSSPGDWYFNVLTSDGCGQTDRDTVAIHVKTLPYLTNNPKRDTLCSGETASIVLQSTFPIASYTWTVQNLSGSISGIGPGTGGVISQTPVQSTSIWDSAIYHITPVANGCTGPDSIFTLLVKPLPAVNLPGAGDAMCSGQTTSIPLTSMVSGAMISWTATCANPLITGYSSGNGSLIAQTLINNSPLADTVFYHVSAIADGCPGDTSHYFVRVNPVPVMTTTPMWDTLCSQGITSITLTASCPGVQYDWIPGQLTGNVTGASGGTGDQIIQQLINQLPTTGAIAYTITPYTSTCTGIDTVFEVWVKPMPQVVNTPSRDTICNNTSTNLILQGDVTGTLFTWTVIQPSGQVTGWSNNTIPAPEIQQVLSNSRFDPDTARYEITPVANGCTGETYPCTFMVYPTPNVLFNPEGQTRCSGQPVSIALSSQVSGTIFNYSTTTNPSITGNHGGSGNLIGDTLFNSATTTETVSYQVTPSAFGCPPGTTRQVTVTVHPRALITNMQTSFTQCNNTSTNIVLQHNLPSPVTFTWTAAASSPQLTGYSDGTGGVIAQTLINAGNVDEQVIYTVFSSANGCPGDTALFTVTVYPTATVTPAPVTNSICSGDNASVGLSSGVTGAVFSWTASATAGISGHLPGTGPVIHQTLQTTAFTPGTVTYTILPTYSGCNGPVSIATVNVRPAPMVVLNTCFDTITLTTAQPMTLKGGLPAGGQYIGTAVTTGVFSPGLAGPGTHPVEYHYTNTFGCADTATLSITVLAPGAFTCGDTLTDPRDMKKYPTILLGSQCWMASNLNYGDQVAGNSNQRDNCRHEKYCFDEDPVNCDGYGGLYQWDEMMQFGDSESIQGICPPGWHVPAEAEWQQLFSTYPPYGAGGAGAALKSTGFSGFDAYVRGIRAGNARWVYSAGDPILHAALFWTSTLHGGRKALSHGLSEVVADNEYSPSVTLYPAGRNQGFYVRCVKD